MLGKGLEALIPPDRQSDVRSQIPDSQKSDIGNQTGPKPDTGFQKSDIGQQKSDNNDLKPETRNPKPETRNLTSEIPASAEASAGRRKPKSEAIFHIEVEKIKPNPHQPRRNFDEEGLRELAASIREFGLLQPIVVTKIEKETSLGTDVEYQLIAGERRWLAAKLLGLERIPAIIRNIDLERERLELAVIENIQRSDLNPIERARAFSRLQDEFRLTQREIASRLGKSREAIANIIRLLDLPAAIQEALEKGAISESHGRLLLAIREPADQEKVFRELLGNPLTTRDLKNRVRQLKAKPEEKEEPIPAELKMLQEKLTSELGAPVEIEKKGERGRITIIFYSPEELQNIVAKLGGDND